LQAANDPSCAQLTEQGQVATAVVLFRLERQITEGSPVEQIEPLIPAILVGVELWHHGQDLFSGDWPWD
jgi:hypothetical protein